MHYSLKKSSLAAMIFGLVGVLAFLMICSSLLGQNGELGTVRITPTNSTTATDMMRNAKLGDGCYHVLLDLGSNVGMHGRFLFEPEKFPHARHALRVYDEHFGPIEKRNNSDFCVFAFEPNPVHKARHLELQDVYGKLGWRYHFQPYAVSNFEGNLTFIHQDNGANNEWGFSTQEGRGGEQTNETIPSIRFAKWMGEHIQNRIIPEEPTNKDALSPTVVMKFDIEGGEWEVMLDVMFSGILCDIVDYSFGELHPWMRAKFMRDMFQIFNADLHDGNCKTKRIDILDDEAYHMDGIPLPDVPE